VLDEAFLAVARRWPSILCVVVSRAERRVNAIMALAAGVRSPQLERRLLALLWHCAERWGYVTSAGVVLPLQLPQVILGDLVRADRSSVNRALRRLHDRGVIARVANGWHLIQSLAEFDATFAAPSGRAEPAVMRATPPEAPF
jgi:CRP/FNR family cyclic AMP-dependent transcriptional regulator